MFLQIFALNLSAPFIAQFFKTQLEQVIPYCDIIIGNEAEAEAWASATGLSEPKDLKAVAKAMALLPKTNASRPRTVVFTQGAQSTIVVTTDAPDKAQVFPVQALANEEIVDTNGAGDAFAGGFLGALVAGKSLEESVEVGHAMGAMCVRQASRSFGLFRGFNDERLNPPGRASIPMAQSGGPVKILPPHVSHLLYIPPIALHSDTIR